MQEIENIIATEPQINSTISARWPWARLRDRILQERIHQVIHRKEPIANEPSSFTVLAILSAPYSVGDRVLLNWTSSAPQTAVFSANNEATLKSESFGENVCTTGAPWECRIWMRHESKLPVTGLTSMGLVVVGNGSFGLDASLFWSTLRLPVSTIRCRHGQMIYLITHFSVMGDLFLQLLSAIDSRVNEGILSKYANEENGSMGRTKISRL